MACFLRLDLNFHLVGVRFNLLAAMRTSSVSAQPDFSVRDNQGADVSRTAALFNPRH